MSLRRLAPLLGPYRSKVALSLALGATTILASIGLMSASNALIARAALLPSIETLSLIVIAVRFFGLSRAGLRYAERLVSHDLTFRVLAGLRVWVYARLEPLAPGLWLTHRSGDLLSRLTADVDTLQNAYLRALAPTVVAGIVCAMFGVWIAFFDLTLMLVALGSLFVCGVIVPIGMMRVSHGLASRQLELRAALAACLVDQVQGLPDLLAMNAEGPSQARVERLNTQLASLQRRQARISSLHVTLVSGGSWLGMFAVLVLAIPLVQAGTIASVDVAMLAVGTLAAFEAVTNLGPAWANLESSTHASARLLELTDARPAVTDPEMPLEKPIDSTLQFEDVRFAYPGSDIPTLEQLSFTLKPGQRLAIVGPSGAGKSTVAGLVSRFFDPDSGRITLGGQPLSAYRQDDVRAMVSVVSQDAHAFNTTIRANLLIANPDASDMELETALERARLLDTVHALPDGLDTWVGELGVRFSGGERQRLAVARAFLKDAPILVLDEATANLDPRTESDLLEVVRELARNRAVLTITHRLIGLEQYDEIIVLDGGRVLERGAHAQLVRARGWYARMLERG